MASSWTALSDGPLMVGIKTFWGEKSGTRNIQGKFPHRDERVSKDKSESYSQPGVALSVSDSGYSSSMSHLPNITSPAPTTNSWESWDHLRGSVPIVFQGYQRCFDLINCARTLSSNVRKAGEKLYLQRKMFDRECRLLLKYIVSQDVAEEMIVDHRHKMWTSAVFESGLARALGTDFELRFKHIKASLQAIERLSKTVPVTRYALIPRS
jgi:hypothetical protein